MLKEHWPNESDWTPRLAPFFESETWDKLDRFVSDTTQTETVYPPASDIFRAFVTPGFAKTKVVILGQDPYHGPGQAHGFSFSVAGDTRLPPSLKNIFKELESDLAGSEEPFQRPDSGDLTFWAEQGVFLLNTVLTVTESQAHSHRKQGWEKFTDYVIQQLNEHPQPLVFILWGKPAESKTKLIDNRHQKIISPHPSPLSANRGFFGSRPFSRANQFLSQNGSTPIRWSH